MPTIERELRAPAAGHHDVTRWDWGGVARALAPACPPRTLQAANPAELRGALRTASATVDRMVVIEAMLPPNDAPPMVRRLAGALTR